MAGFSIGALGDSVSNGGKANEIPASAGLKEEMSALILADAAKWRVAKPNATTKEKGESQVVVVMNPVVVKDQKVAPVVVQKASTTQALIDRWTETGTLVDLKGGWIVVTEAVLSIG